MRRSPRLIGTVALLILALVVAAVLAYQALGRRAFPTANGRRHAARLRQDRRLAAHAAGEERAAHAGRDVADRAGVAAPARLAGANGARAGRGRGRRARHGELVRLPVRRALLLSLRLEGRNASARRRRIFPTPIWPGRATRWSPTPTRSARCATRRCSPSARPTDGPGPLKKLAVILTNESYAMLFGERNQQAGARRVRRRARRRRVGCRSKSTATSPIRRPFLAPAFASIRGKPGEHELAPAGIAHRGTADRFDSFDLGHDARRHRGLQVAGLGGADLQRRRHRGAELRPADHAREPQPGVRRNARRRRPAQIARADARSRCS